MKPKLTWILIMSLVYLFVFNMPLFAQQTNRQIELNRDLIFLVIILLVTLFFISIFKKNKINKKIENELEDRLTERTRELSLMNEKLIVELNEHRLAVEALKNSEEHYRYLFERNPAILFIFEHDTLKILAVNDAFIQFYGYSRDDALSMILPDLYPDEEKESISTVAKKTGSLISSTEWHHIRRGGSVVSIIGSSSDLIYQEKKAHIVVVTDITILKKSEEQELKLNQFLEDRVTERTAQLFASNNELESYSYSISHDLRAPLRAIYGFSQILANRHRESLNEEGRQYMDYIVQACIRMEQLINDLLNYSRIGRNYIDIVPIPVGKIIDDMRIEFKQRLDEIGAEFSTDKEYPVINGEENLLRLIFTNLIDNAIKYRRVEVKLKISIHCEKVKSEITILVSDNGIGIPDEFLDKIFNIFQRLHSEEDYPGTGIGLATVRKSVNMLHGEVWAESKVGEGSTFIIQFPEFKINK